MTKNQPELKACELKSCPFCDHPPKHTYVDSFANNSIGCVNLDCEFQPCTNKNYSTKEAAIAAWNTRTSPIIPEDAVTIVELREILGIKNKADESVIEHVKEIIRINKRLFADWQKTFFEETDAKNAVQPVTDDDLRDAILDAQNFIDDKYEGSITRSTVQTLVTRAIKGQSK